MVIEEESDLKIIIKEQVCHTIEQSEYDLF